MFRVDFIIKYLRIGDCKVGNTFDIINILNQNVNKRILVKI